MEKSIKKILDKNKSCEHKYKGLYYRAKINDKDAWIRVKNIYICEKCLSVRRLEKIGS